MKFILVGLSGVLVNYAVLFLSVDVFHLSDSISIGLAITISMTTNYILNRIWTFKSNNDIPGEYIRYILSNSLGALIQFVTAISLEKMFEARNIFEFNLLVIDIKTIYIATGFGILLGFVSNYILSKYIVFIE